MIDVSSKIKICEIAGEEVTVGAEGTLVIEPHWSRRELVNIRFPGDATIAININDLKVAVENAQNVNRD